jgi:DNA invertase Pin-like site-specific DNA recombinase
VSTDQQDLTRQQQIEEDARAAGFYIAGVYREKASGARADRPELLRLIADLQPGEAVISEKIDRISRLPLPEAEKLVEANGNCADVISGDPGKAELAVDGRSAFASPTRACIR